MWRSTRFWIQNLFLYFDLNTTCFLAGGWCIGFLLDIGFCRRNIKFALGKKFINMIISSLTTLQIYVFLQNWTDSWFTWYFFKTMRLTPHYRNISAKQRGSLFGNLLNGHKDSLIALVALKSMCSEAIRWILTVLWDYL